MVTKIMKNLLKLLVFTVIFLACGKDTNRKSGVCYCDFFQGDDKEYKLSNLSRQEQIDACNVHDTNAAKFCGRCELEKADII